MDNTRAFNIKIASWQDQQEQLRHVRELVFVQEQHVPIALEWDEEDESALHILASDYKGHAIGTARLLRNGQIGRMAVLKSHRHNGIGSAMLQYLLDIAINFCHEPLFLHAQTTAIPFYEKFDFCTSGDVFMDAGIEHKKMVFLPQQRLTLSTAQLGIDYQRFALTDYHQTLAALNGMMSQARRYLRIFTPDLDRLLYDTDHFKEQLSAFARISRHSEVRILLQLKEDIIHNGHRVLDLCRKLPSKIAIKTLTRREDIDPRSYLLADTSGIIYRPEYEDYQGYCNFHGKNEVENLQTEFDRQWNTAFIDPHFRDMTL